MVANEFDGSLASPEVLLFGAASTAVERFDVGNVGVGEVTDENLQVTPAGVAEGELRAGVGVFAAGDYAGLFGSVRQIDELGDFGDFGMFWVGSDFARRILGFSTLLRAGLVVLEKEAASDGFSAKVGGLHRWLRQVGHSGR